MKTASTIALIVTIALISDSAKAVLPSHSDYGCMSCHTPHNAGTGALPLWNGAATTSTFQMYTSPHFESLTPVTTGQPSGSSKLCLSCHDGVTTITETFSDPNDILGTNLTTSHPFSFVYDAVLAGRDATLMDPTTQSSGLGDTIAHDLLDMNNELQCASCHDPHTSAIGGTKYLRYPYSTTAGDLGLVLCRTCHRR